MLKLHETWTNLTHSRVPDRSMKQFRSVDKDHSKGSTGTHLANQSQSHADPEIFFRHKARAETRETGEDLTDGEDGSAAANVDCEENDEVGQDLHPGHQASPLEQVLLAGVEAQAVEAHRDH